MICEKCKNSLTELEELIFEAVEELEGEIECLCSNCALLDGETLH